MKRLVTLVMTLGLLTATAYAHNGMEHVMGTVTNVTDTAITVKTTNGKLQTVVLNADTKYAKMDKAITLKDIKVGDHVVVHATKKGDQLIAVTVKVGMDMKGMGGMKMGGSGSQKAPQWRAVSTSSLRTMDAGSIWRNWRCSN